MTNPKPTVNRTIGLFTSTLLVIGVLIGSGVFKKIVPMAQSGLEEWAILLAWLVAGIVTIFGALTISGLATVTEANGGMYEYFRIAFGDFFSFLSGWSDFTIVGSGSIAAIAFLFGHITGSIINLPNPMDDWAAYSIGNFIYPFADSGIKLVALSSVIILTVLNYMGTREGAIFNNIVTSAKIIGILFLIIAGLYFSPTLPDAATVSANTGDTLFFTSFFSALLGAFWAYDGWVVTTSLSGEMIKPKKNLPIAIVGGVSVVIFIYLLINYVFLKLMPLHEIALINENEIGAIKIFETYLGKFAVSFVLILVSISVFGSLNGNIISYPRKYHRMAEEGYFFQSASEIHPKNKTPHIAIFMSGLWVSVLLVSGTFEMLTDMVIFTGFIFYGMLSIALIKLKRNGTIKTKIFGYPYIPILFFIFSVILSLNTIWTQPLLSLFGILLIASGLPFYFYFKKKIKVHKRN